MKVAGTDSLHWPAFAVPFAPRSVVVADPLLLFRVQGDRPLHRAFGYAHTTSTSPAYEGHHLFLCDSLRRWVENSNTSPNGTGALCVVATAPVTRSVAILKHLVGPVRGRVIDDTEAFNDNLQEFKSFCN